MAAREFWGFDDTIAASDDVRMAHFSATVRMAFLRLVDDGDDGGDGSEEEEGSEEEFRFVNRRAEGVVVVAVGALLQWFFGVVVLC